MLLDFCKMTSTTGGTGALTCTAQTGFPDAAEAFTGTVFIDYSIAEYTSSAKTQLSKAETGIGSYVTSTGVLTRTKVLSTWNGTDYLPKFGTATAPTALSFGTTSANIDIMVSTIAASLMPLLQFVYGTVASVADGLGVLGGNYISQGAPTQTSGTVYYSPLYIERAQFFSQATFRSATALTGGSPTLDVAIYAVGSDGTPSTRLVRFTQFTGIGTTNTTYTSTAIATPIWLNAGWYWLATLYLAAGATGNFQPRSGQFRPGGPGGTLFATVPAYASKSRASQTVLNDPATAPTAVSNEYAILFAFK